VFKILVTFVIKFRQLIPMTARLSRGSATSRLLELPVRIPPGSWIFCDIFVLLSRSFCVGPIAHS